MATCLVIEHAPAESSYLIGEALSARGVRLDRRLVFAGDDLPDDLGGVDGLVIMGGPMSAASDDGFPTRARELALVVDALDRSTPMIGVCLGAQLLAAATGGAVYPGPAGPEVGWAPVFLTDAPDPLFAGLPPSWTVLHWHGDTFDLPGGAVHLAASDRYPNQAFRIGDRAWGVQFHLEVDRDAVTRFAGDFPEEAAAAPGGVTGSTADAALAALDPIRGRLLERFAAMVAATEVGKKTVMARSGNFIA